MQKLLYLLFFNILICTALIYGQPDLDVRPHTIEFEDEFFRFEKVYLINKGDEALRIDSLTYKYNSYFLRFNSYYTFPFFIAPGDTVPMDCILSNYFTVTQADTADTMYVYHNGEDYVTDVKIKIDFFDNNFREGTVSGRVLSAGTPLAYASVHFLYEGNFIYRSVYTDRNGNYSAFLPAGYYTAAAEKDSHYVSFSNGSSDPFNAGLLNIKGDSSYVIDFNLSVIENTGISISGSIMDSISNAPIRKGLVVVRKGTHTPGKPSHNKMADDMYTAFIDYDGKYEIDGISNPDYYYIQGFSHFYVPGYFTQANAAPVFWQQADSVFVSGPAVNTNFSLLRDSSVGGGIISGLVNTGVIDAPPGNTVIYAQSADYNGQFFNFAIPYGEGQFKVSNLPYGNYNLRAQIIGYEDVLSSTLTINPANTAISNIVLSFQPSEVGDNNSQVNRDFILYNNYPNPFNPFTTISFKINSGQSGSIPVKLFIYDQLGRETALLLDEELSSGEYKINFNGSGLSSGVYYVVLRSGSNQKYQKMILMK